MPRDDSDEEYSSADEEISISESGYGWPFQDCFSCIDEQEEEEEDELIDNVFEMENLCRSSFSSKEKPPPLQIPAGRSSKPVQISGAKSPKFRKRMLQRSHSCQAVAEEAWRRRRDQFIPADDASNAKRALTDEDFDELRGCIDLGFRFSSRNNPELCNTLPALEYCYAISRQVQLLQLDMSSPASAASSPSTDQGSAPVSASDSSISEEWRISSPGDRPQEVKERLRHWAQAVACNVMISSSPG